MERVDVKDLKDLSFLAYGSDTYIYRCSYNGKDYIYKIYDYPNGFFSDTFERKHDILNEMKLCYSAVPRFLVMDKEESGVLTEYLKKSRIRDLKDQVSKYRELQRVKKSIVELHENGVVHGDIHSGNIMSKGSDKILIDFDNSVISSFPDYRFNIDACSPTARNFVSYNGVVKNLDIFLFNFLTYCELNNCFLNTGIESAYEASRCAIAEGYYGIFLNSDSRRVCNELLDHKADCFLIDTISSSDVKKYSPMIRSENLYGTHRI